MGADVDLTARGTEALKERTTAERNILADGKEARGAREEED